MGVLYGCIALCAAMAQADDPSLEDARTALATLQPELLQLIALTPADLAKTKPEFQEYYQTDIEPRFQHIGANIKASAMHWINIDPRDDRPELICWTEGLAPSAWGAKEYLFVIKVPETGNPTLLKSYRLDPEPTRRVEEYYYVRFTAHPNKELGTNEFLAAVFSYMQLGASASTFANYEIGWDRYAQEIYIDRFFSSFPVMVEQVDVD